MSALEVVHMRGSSYLLGCQEPRDESGKLCLRSASAKVSICGAPWVRMCRAHAVEARAIWDEFSPASDEIEAAA
jgi:hypothetical protein